MNPLHTLEAHLPPVECSANQVTKLSSVVLRSNLGEHGLDSYGVLVKTCEDK